MRPIYKSLALASTVLQVSLALNAQTRDDESASTMALPADLLDSLRVELVALNVSGARNLIESGECVIDGSNLTITLNTSEWTRGAMYRLQVLATFGTQTQVIYALNITVPYYIALSDTPQEYEDDVMIVSTITDVTEADLEGLALEATSQEIKAAITPIATAAEAYNVGKTQLAAAITSKGVETSPTESYPELAAKVRDIQQRTIDITAPNWYGGQIGADGSLWDLYAVLAKMKNQWLGADHYKALIVCEYYKGYDSLQLQGADAYYTCDGDFYDISSPLHVWHDEDNGKMNRWVCFLFASEGARFDITNTSISPRSMYIGGHIGTIEYFVNGRLTELVSGIEETDVVDSFISGTYTQNWGFKTILQNVYIKQDMTINNSGFVDVATDVTTVAKDHPILISNASYVNIHLKNRVLDPGVYTGIAKLTGSKIVVIDGNIGPLSTNPYIYFRCISCVGTSPEEIYTPGYKGGGTFIHAENTNSLILVEVGEANTSIRFNWNPTNVLADADKKAKLINNIKNHILARVSDATGGTQLVFTVSTNMYNNIASEQIEWNGETMSLADAFLTKNWLLAGA